MFEYLKQNHIPFRVKVKLEVEKKQTAPELQTTYIGEKLTITENTHVYYPQVTDDNIGFSSTSFGDRNPWPTGLAPTNEETDVSYDTNDETVSGGYGFDYLGQPNNTTYRGPSHQEPYGDSISPTEVNGLIIDLSNTTIIIDNTGF